MAGSVMTEPPAAPESTGKEAVSSHAAAAADRELVLKVHAGDVSAFDQLVEKHKARIYGVIYNMLSNHEDAADLSQNVFIQAFKSIHGFRSESNFYTWLYRIAVNTTLNFLKQRKEIPLSLNELDADTEKELVYEELTAKESVHGDINRVELQKILNKALQKLSKEHRMVVVLHDIEGLRHHEIARVLRCTEATARSRLFYAHQELQSLLAKYI